MNAILLEAINGALASQYLIASLVFSIFIARQRFNFSEPIVFGGLFIAMNYAGEGIVRGAVWVAQFMFNHGFRPTFENDGWLLGGAMLASVSIVGVIYIFIGASGLGRRDIKVALLAASTWIIFFAIAYMR